MLRWHTQHYVCVTNFNIVSFRNLNHELINPPKKTLEQLKHEKHTHTSTFVQGDLTVVM